MNGSTSSSAFCQDPLWDSQVTWYTENPDFTTCFHQTVLIYVPSGLLLILAPIQLSLARHSKDAQVPWAILPILKLSLTGLLTVFCIVDLIYQLTAQVKAAFFYDVSNLALDRD